MKPQFKVALPVKKQARIFTLKRKTVSKVGLLVNLKLSSTLTLPVMSKKEVAAWAVTIQYAQKQVRRRFTYRTRIEKGIPVIKIWRVT